jgi:hypothetical protein
MCGEIRPKSVRETRLIPTIEMSRACGGFRSVVPMDSLMPGVRHINAGSLFAQIAEAGRTWLRHWIGLSMSRLLDKAVDDPLGCERYDPGRRYIACTNRVTFLTVHTILSRP